MSKNTLDDLFKNIENDFDIETPDLGHQERFSKKLNTQNSISNNRKSNFWKPFIGIAASIALIVSLFIFTSKEDNTIEVTKTEPEIAKIETLFMASLSKELKKLNSEDMPEYQEIIVDALFQLQILEEDYNQLTLGLKETPKNKLILDAMILNFQSRINVIQDTKDNISDLKKTIKKVSII